MKKKFLFMSVMASLFLAGCSQEEIAPKGEDGGINGATEHYMTLQISNPVTRGTRTTGKVTTLDGNDYEEGYGNENEIKTLRLYFFDEAGASIGISGGKNYVDVTVEAGSPDMSQTVEMTYSSTVTLYVNKTTKARVKQVAAVANYTPGDDSMSLDALRQKIGGSEYVHGTDGFLMTSSSYIGTDSKFVCTTKINDNNFFDTKNAAENALKSTASDADKAKLVQIYLERLETKVRVSHDWKSLNPQFNTEIKENVTFSGETGLVAVGLKNAEGMDIKVNQDGTEKQVYALFHGWDVTNTINTSYLFKKINANWTDQTLFTAWNNAAFKRSYWAMNPDGATYSYKKYSEIKRKFYKKATETSYKQEDTKDAIAYCFENAADNFENGTKILYNPLVELSNRTQVIMAATLVTLDADNLYTPLELVKWMGVDYDKTSVKADMYNTYNISTRYWVEDNSASDENKALGENTDSGKDTADEGTTEKKYKSIPIDGLILKYGNDIESLRNAEASKRYLNYLQLADTNTKYYTRTQNVNEKTYTYTEVSAEVINKWLLENVPGAQIWQSGKTYYYTDIMHFGTENTKRKYGVVRNHIYDIKLQKVTGLGTPVVVPEEGEDEQPIIPQHPEEDEAYIAAKINVLAWRVVKNNISLDW